jgi:hypothetical protein
MSLARNLARLFPNASGLLPNANIEAMAASKLTGQVPDANAPSGSVIQVVGSGLIANPGVGTTSTSGVDVTAYSLSITPSSASSRIVCVSSFGISAGGSGSTQGAFGQLRRQIGSGSFNGLFPSVANFDYTSASIGLNGPNSIATVVSYNFVDSPATTSTLTYRIRLYSNGTNYVFTTSAGFHMTLMEIAG